MIIYKVENLINGKVYIGKTIKSLNRRKTEHYSAVKQGSQYVFHKALRKYNENIFDWSIIATAKSEKELLEIEKFFISQYKKEKVLYNMTDGGDGISGYKHTNEAKNKMSRKDSTHSKETKKIMSEKHKGKKYSLGYKHTEESRIKNSESHKGHKVTDETKLKLSKANSGENNPHAILNNSKVRIIKFLLKRNDMSVKEIAYFFDVNPYSIHNIKQKKHWKNI
jgi:group I intron endonuclease